MFNARALTRLAIGTSLTLALTGGLAGAAQAQGRAPSVGGSVTSVNGDSTPGTCGTAGATGQFTVLGGGVNAVAVTVNVTPATSFVEKKVAAPTFANVCVGDNAGAIGVQTAGVMDATGVSINVPKSTHAFGTVTAVNGVATSGTCGTARATGAFTLSTLVSGSQVVSTVFVTPSTKFTVGGGATTTFAGLCVGYYADAEGLAVGNTVLASSVKVRVPKPPTPLHVRGLVTSVNGATSAGTCGTADTAGSFVITWTDRSATLIDTTVVVAATTPFSGRSGVTSFADVCVGAKAAAIGSNSSGGLDAVSVATYPIPH